MRGFLSPAEVEGLRAKWPGPFEAVERLRTHGPGHGDGALPVKNYLIQRNETHRSPLLAEVNSRLLALANGAFRGARPRGNRGSFDAEASARVEEHAEGATYVGPQ